MTNLNIPTEKMRSLYQLLRKVKFDFGKIELYFFHFNANSLELYLCIDAEKLINTDNVIMLSLTSSQVSMIAPMFLYNQNFNFSELKDMNVGSFNDKLTLLAHINFIKSFILTRVKLTGNANSHSVKKSVIPRSYTGNNFFDWLEYIKCNNKISIILQGEEDEECSQFLLSQHLFAEK